MLVDTWSIQRKDEQDRRSAEGYAKMSLKFRVRIWEAKSTVRLEDLIPREVNRRVSTQRKTDLTGTLETEARIFRHSQRRHILNRYPN